MSGTLTIVGLGPGPAELVTLEAAELLRNASVNQNARVFGFSPVRSLAATLAPNLEITMLDELVGGEERATAYQRIIGRLMKDAFKEGLDVVYLASGNPLVVNDLVLFLRRACKRYAKPVRLIHGLSFVELMLGRVFWQADRGLQLVSAWSVAEGGIALDPRAPALVYEIGETAQDQTNDAMRGMLEAVKERLSALYPPDHPVILVFSTGPPNFACRSQHLQLSALGDATVTPLSNLWIPSLSGPALERDEAP